MMQNDKFHTTAKFGFWWWKDQSWVSRDYLTLRVLWTQGKAVSKDTMLYHNCHLKWHHETFRIFVMNLQSLYDYHIWWSTALSITGYEWQRGLQQLRVMPTLRGQSRTSQIQPSRYSSMNDVLVMFTAAGNPHLTLVKYTWQPKTLHLSSYRVYVSSLLPQITSQLKSWSCWSILIGYVVYKDYAWWHMWVFTELTK